MSDCQPEYPIGHLSYSSISTYLLCGRCWELRYIERRPAPTSPALLFGGAFHETIEAYLRARVLDGVSLDLADLWQASWEDKLIAEWDTVVWGDEGERDRLLVDGRRMVQTEEVQATLAAIRPAVAAGGSVLIETRFEMAVPGVPVPVIGFIDVIEDDGVPGDFKTAGRAWSQTQAQGELQPAFYLAALAQDGWEDNPGLRFRHYVFTKGRSPQAQVIETGRTPADLAFVFELTRRVWGGIAAGIFVPNPTTWKCSPRMCEYWDICRGGP